MLFVPSSLKPKAWARQRLTFNRQFYADSSFLTIFRLIFIWMIHSHSKRSDAVNRHALERAQL